MSARSPIVELRAHGALPSCHPLPTIQMKKKNVALFDFPDGILWDQVTTAGRSVVRKEGREIHLYYADPLQAPPLAITGYMSRIDVHDPSLLLSPYTQAFLLALLWQPDPGMVYMAGFGGGRVPWVLHHYLPACRIESTDTDPAMALIAHWFFDMQFDARQVLTTEDAARYLERIEQKRRYDVIFVDIFDDTSATEERFRSSEFLKLCQGHLSRGGVVAMNVVAEEKDMNELEALFAQTFGAVYWYTKPGTTVLFGVNGPMLPISECHLRAREVSKRWQLPLRLDSLVHKLYPIVSSV